MGWGEMSNRDLHFRLMAGSAIRKNAENCSEQDGTVPGTMPRAMNWVELRAG
jgi:hypothetical protein